MLFEECEEARRRGRRHTNAPIIEERIMIPNLRCYSCQVDRDSRDSARERRRVAREYAEIARGQRRAARDAEIARDRRRAAREDMEMEEASPLQQLHQIVDEMTGMFRADENTAADVSVYADSADSADEDEDDEDEDSNSDNSGIATPGALPGNLANTQSQDGERRLRAHALEYVFITIPVESLREEDRNCSICMETMGKASHEHAAEVPTHLLFCDKHPCGNLCLTEWLMEHDTCPVCRHDYKKELSRALRARLP
jgi:hypothetical protein